MKRTFASLVIGLSLFMGTATGAWAQDFDKGLAAARAGDFGTALKEWRPLAEQGYALAQFNLGLMYYNGQGVLQDYKEAAKWYRLAAEQGQASAQYSLGLMHFKGQGVPENYKEAAKWYRKSAEQGFADAQTHLGLLYLLGRGVIQDNIQAHMWTNLAASNGNKLAFNGRDIAAKRMTAEDISKAQQLARECVAKNYKGC